MVTLIDTTPIQVSGSESAYLKETILNRADDVFWIFKHGNPIIPAELNLLKKLKDKKIIVFCCGASPYEQNAFEAIVKHNFTGELAGLPCFYCRGTFDMSEMSFKDRTLCKMLRKVVSGKNPNEYEAWEKGLMEVGENERGDWIDKAYIEPIIEAV